MQVPWRPMSPHLAVDVEREAPPFQQYAVGIDAPEDRLTEHDEGCMSR